MAVDKFRDVLTCVFIHHQDLTMNHVVRPVFVATAGALLFAAVLPAQTSGQNHRYPNVRTQSSEQSADQRQSKGQVAEKKFPLPKQILQGIFGSRDNEPENRPPAPPSQWRSQQPAPSAANGASVPRRVRKSPQSEAVPSVVSRQTSTSAQPAAKARIKLRSGFASAPYHLAQSRSAVACIASAASRDSARTRARATASLSIFSAPAA